VELPRGGRRPHAGRKKGSKERSTLAKLTALEIFRQRAEAELGPLITAQLETAKGLFHFLAKTETGYVRVTDPQVMDRYLAIGDGFKIAAQDPDVRALKDTFDRVCGKPVEQVELSGPQQGPIPVKFIDVDA
jgi:hypothetical protein